MKSVSVSLGWLSSFGFGIAFRKLMAASGMPVKTQFKLRGIATFIQDEMKKYEEQRMSFVNELAEKDDAGQLKKERNGNVEVFVFSPENQKAFNDKLKELQEIEVQVPSIKIDDLGSVQGLVPDDIFQLRFIVE